MKKNICERIFCTTIVVLLVCTATPKYTHAKTIEDIAEVSHRLYFESLEAGIQENEGNKSNVPQKSQISFAVFTDTHIGVRYQNPLYSSADHLDALGEDLVDSTNQLDFALHLGDIVHHTTAQVNGIGLPWFVNQYKNNFKAYLVSHVHLPFYCVIGNHDVNDYQMNRDDPHNLTKSILDELSMNSPVYAMMRDGILFLTVPELGCITWTHPVEYEWLEYMTSQYPNATTIMFSHQAIEDTTGSLRDEAYRGKQDMDWWATFFQKNPQIKLWIHGHNHYLDWYLSNQSTGRNYSVRVFGHEMAFSAPYPQMYWDLGQKLDHLIIYNVSSTGISTASWENNGADGHWVSDYVHSWNIPTSFDSHAQNWYSFPVFLQDNETQLTDMKVFSPNITLQLIGTVPMELFFDAQMESPSGWANETVLGFGNDTSANVEWIKPGMRVHGPSQLTFPEKYPHHTHLQEDGRSGQPYHSFPMGTICAAVPGQTYNFTITGRCSSGMAPFRMNVSCCDWETKSQYSVLPGSEQQVFAYTFGQTNETLFGSYTVPNNRNAWFLQGTLDFLNATQYDVSSFSVKRQRTSDTTDDFHLYLSGHWYNASGSLMKNEQVNFTVDPIHLCDWDGVMNFTACINGNRYGMVNLMYHEPILMGMNARFRINSKTDTIYNLSLTKTLTRTSSIDMVLWHSKMFQRFPYFIELFYRFLMKGVTGYILKVVLEKLIPDLPATFSMVPFSTKPLYAEVNVTAVDGSGAKHESMNGNIWWTSNCPSTESRFVKVTVPTS
ncbi:MAG: metallophosphoesterase [Candidatus Thermoplasmatota archaeon]|nr:metallophosphoesterase [Candidatus Thermoplasmatota archaeon]